MKRSNYNILICINMFDLTLISTLLRFSSFSSLREIHDMPCFRSKFFGKCVHNVHSKLSFNKLARLWFSIGMDTQSADLL